MESVIRVFDIGEAVRETAIEAGGHRWLVYWVLGESSERCYMTDGTRYVEILNPHEFQAIYMDASAIMTDEPAACDLACERLRLLMEQRGHWRELQ